METEMGSSTRWTTIFGERTSVQSGPRLLAPLQTRKAYPNRLFVRSWFWEGSCYFTACVEDRLPFRRSTDMSRCDSPSIGADGRLLNLEPRHRKCLPAARSAEYRQS